MSVRSYSLTSVVLAVLMDHMGGRLWEKIRGWRAGTAGRAVGASVGPTLDILEDAHP